MKSSKVAAIFDVSRHKIFRNIQPYHYFLTTTSTQTKKRWARLTLMFDFSHRSRDDSLIDFTKVPGDGKDGDGGMVPL